MQLVVFSFSIHEPGGGFLRVCVTDCRSSLFKAVIHKSAGNYTRVTIMRDEGVRV